MGQPRYNLLSPWSRLLPVLSLALTANGCTYLKYASVQSEYARIQASAPEQINIKHMIDRDTFFVHGKSIDYAGSFDSFPKAVAAYSSRRSR